MHITRLLKEVEGLGTDEVYHYMQIEAIGECMRGMARCLCTIPQERTDLERNLEESGFFSFLHARGSEILLQEMKKGTELSGHACVIARAMIEIHSRGRFPRKAFVLEKMPKEVKEWLDELVGP